MKRNYINEIVAIKSRSEFNSRHDFSNRLDDIEFALKENLSYNGDFDKELIRYIPIATVACFESFFRSVYRELVDFGKPFSDNVINFNQSKNVRFDFSIVNAIQRKTISVGEFIAHILPCNNYSDINSNLSILAGIDFTKCIREFKKKSVFENANENSNKFLENSTQIISDVKRTFELRHIFCHEFATNLKIEKEEILRCFDNCRVFLQQTNEFIFHLIYPNAPETQADMNAYALETLKEAEEELNELISTVKKASKENFYWEMNEDRFDDTMTEWGKYCEAKAFFDALPHEGGQMHTLIYAGSKTTTTKEKIESLKREYEVALRRYSSS